MNRLHQKGTNRCGTVLPGTVRMDEVYCLKVDLNNVNPYPANVENMVSS